MEESFLILPASNPRHLTEKPEDAFVWSCHGLDDTLFHQMMLANKASTDFLAGKINFFDYMDVLEFIGVSDPLEIMSDIMAPYVYSGLLL